MTNGMSRAREGRALAALKVSGWGNWVNDDPSADLSSTQLK